MSEFQFLVHGVPAPKGSLRGFIPKGWTRPVLTSTTGPRLKDWAHSVSVCALQARGQQTIITGAVMLEAIFFFDRPKSARKRMHVTVRPDVDKVLRSTCDALTGILFNDDAQIVRMIGEKRYADQENPPGAFITVRSLDVFRTQLLRRAAQVSETGEL